MNRRTHFYQTENKTIVKHKLLKPIPIHCLFELSNDQKQHILTFKDEKRIGLVECMPGKSGHGSVFKVMCENKYYVLKFAAKDERLGEYQDMEVTIYRKLKDLQLSFIMKSCEQVLGANYYIIVFQAQTVSMDMFEQIKSPARRNNTNSLKTILLNSIAGLIALHGKGIVHRDFKPENVILEIVRKKVHTVYIIDFGFSISSDRLDDRQDRQSCGTLQYMSQNRKEGKPTKFNDDFHSFKKVMEFFITLIKNDAETEKENAETEQEDDEMEQENDETEQKYSPFNIFSGYIKLCDDLIKKTEDFMICKVKDSSYLEKVKTTELGALRKFNDAFWGC